MCCFKNGFVVSFTMYKIDKLIKLQLTPPGIEISLLIHLPLASGLWWLLLFLDYCIVSLSVSLPVIMFRVVIVFLAMMLTLSVAEYPMAKSIQNKRFYIYPLPIDNWYAFPVITP